MKKEQGFTLIELLVVVFIIAILAGVLLPNFVSSRERARDARRKHDLAEIKNALRLYYNDHQSYPASLSFGSSWSPYMQLVPQDLITGREYHYCVTGDGDAFVLCAQLENAGDQDVVDSSARCSSICSCSCDGACYYLCGD